MGFWRTTSAITIALWAGQAIAEETRQLDAHEHGVGALNIAVEGTTVALTLEVPGADIVGFEYAPSTAEDRAAIDAAVATLAKPLDLFLMPAAAGCSVTKAAAALEGGDGDHDDHGHDDHGHSHDHDHAHDDDHGAEDQAEAEVHSEFHAEYVLACADPAALDQIIFAYFDMFPNALELEVQLVTEAGAQAFEVLRADPILSLRGVL